MGNAQNFKGDESELKMRGSGEPMFDLTGASLDEFDQSGADSDAFLLMLYDSGRMPFSNRIARDAFVSFIRQALANFPFMGSFESYLFIIREIFGPDAIVSFDVSAPGKLSISIDASSDLVFDFLGRELVSGSYEFFTLIDDDGEGLLFRGLSGIDDAYQLHLLFLEIIPAGISPTLSLDFYSEFTFIGEDGSGTYEVTTHIGDSILFTEI